MATPSCSFFSILQNEEIHLQFFKLTDNSSSFCNQCSQKHTTSNGLLSKATSSSYILLANLWTLRELIVNPSRSPVRFSWCGKFLHPARLKKKRFTVTP